MDDQESVGQAVPVHVPASTFHRGFCTRFCYFSIFPLIFHAFILAVGNFSSESADSEVLLRHWLGTTQQFCVGLQKMFCPIPRTFLFSLHILMHRTDRKIAFV